MPQWLFHDLPDRHARIERRIGVLENHLNVRTVRPHFIAAQLRQIHRARRVVIDDAARDFHAVNHRAQNIDNRPPHRALAASRFAHQPQRFALFESRN